MKRKASSTEKSTTNDATSPYEARSNQFQEWRKRYDESTKAPHLILTMTDVYESLADQYDESPEEWSSEQRKENEQALTQAEIDEHYHSLVIPAATYELYLKLRKEITYADKRNDPSDGFVMLNTHSSWCMYPVLQQQLKSAQRLLKRQLKSLARALVRPSRSRRALQVVPPHHRRTLELLPKLLLPPLHRSLQLTLSTTGDTTRRT
jgi:hypothetical protein